MVEGPAPEGNDEREGSVVHSRASQVLRSAAAMVAATMSAVADKRFEHASDNVMACRVVQNAIGRFTTTLVKCINDKQNGATDRIEGEKWHVEMLFDLHRSFLVLDTRIDMLDQNLLELARFQRKNLYQG